MGQQQRAEDLRPAALDAELARPPGALAGISQVLRERGQARPQDRVRDDRRALGNGQRGKRPLDRIVGQLGDSRELGRSLQDRARRGGARRDAEVPDLALANDVVKEIEQAFLPEVLRGALVEQQDVHVLGPELSQARLQARSRLRRSEAACLDHGLRATPQDTSSAGDQPCDCSGARLDRLVAG